LLKPRNHGRFGKPGHDIAYANISKVTREALIYSAFPESISVASQEIGIERERMGNQVVLA
jgi:hypothetical protein